MKFSLSWLKDHLDTNASSDAIAAKLNAIGLEVESVSDPSARLAGFRIARVVSAEPHPDADKLRVLQVRLDPADTALTQVVCGAPNARAGLVGVLGLPGAVVPGNGMVLKRSAIRGVESNGMMCSTRELELGEDHDGIIELPEDAPVGQPFADYLGADPVFDVAITPNRPDCMGVHGIARDLAAAGMGTLKAIEASPDRDQPPCLIAIRTDDPAGCPAFYGRVISGVRNGPSPDWLVARLKSAGQRSISALVDITNYVMLAYGRPSHAYDLAKLTGAVVARRARAGEQLTALNGKVYVLTPAMTVIADDAGVLDIGGIMGGEHSGVSDATTDILLEVAYFDPARIGATGRELNLASDARARFERGVDPGFLDEGLALLTRLIIEICGGEPTQIVRAGSAPTTPNLVHYDPALAQTLGGVAVPLTEQRVILAALGFTVVGEDAEHATDWAIAAPTWRPDVDGVADIVEEVVRIHGLDKVASVALPRADGVARPTATPSQKLERRVRRAAAARGLCEAITWSFVPEPDADAFAEGNGTIWTLANPISEELKAMRPSLLPGLLAAARRGLDRGADSVRLFEIGCRYLRGDGGRSDERLTLGLVLEGEKRPRGWQDGKATHFDAYDAKAEALALLEEAGAPVDNLQVFEDAGPQFHPGRSGTLRLGPKTILARFGILHPRTAHHFGLDGQIAVAELYLDAIPAKRGQPGFARKPYSPAPLQSVRRDFAFLTPSHLPAGDLIRSVRAADKANIIGARVFDDFRGTGVPDGQKSLAVEVLLQPIERSYADADLKAISDRISAAVAKLGGTLRG